MGVVRRPIRARLGAFALLFCLAVVQLGLRATEATYRPTRAQVPSPPNVVLILTDDQRFDSLRVMPVVRRLLMARGMTLRRAIVTNPLCCPSRATIFTGRYSHTTGVYRNSPPFGGWSTFEPSESNTVATALHDAGYRTALIGKYMNGYRSASEHVPPGWDRWFAVAGNGAYYGYTVYDNLRGFLRFGFRPKDYSTDVFRKKAVSFLRNSPAGTPVFLVLAPFAPHPLSKAAPRHEGRFARAPVRLGAAVNEADVSDKPAYIAARSTVEASLMRARTRDQWESLLAVDEMVAKVMSTLAETGRAGNTLVVFTSDNGFLNGEHRWLGKQVPYEGSIRVPMIVRLPGQIPANTVSGALVSNVDLAPTIADFAGTSMSADGVSMRPLLTDRMNSVRDSVLLEHVHQAESVPTYCGVRTATFTFVRYATGEEELYDLTNDPRQLENVAAARPAKATQLRALAGSLCRPVPPGFSW